MVGELSSMSIDILRRKARLAMSEALAQRTATPARASGSQLDAALKALASEQRREILRILGESTPDYDKTCCSADELCACKLVERLGLAQSTISHHMSVLRHAGLVSARKDGLWVYYTLRRPALEEVAETLRSL
jgi:ArsR family transcriptional regulator